MQRKPDWYYTQSGVIPYRICRKEIEVLLITSRKGKRWIIPKGIVESEMSPAGSAAQEAWEEAGLRGQMSKASIGFYEYQKWNGVCQVEVFLLHVEEEATIWPESSFRDRRWFSLIEAAESVRENDLAQMMKSLWSYV